MLQATRFGGDHRQHHECGDEEDADDAHRHRDRERGEHGDDDVEPVHRHTCDAAPLLVEDGRDEPAEEDGDRGEGRPPSTSTVQRSSRVTVRIEPNRYWNRLTLSAPALDTSTTPAAIPV